MFDQIVQRFDENLGVADFGQRAGRRRGNRGSFTSVSFLADHRPDQSEQGPNLLNALRTSWTASSRLFLARRSTPPTRPPSAFAHICGCFCGGVCRVSVL